MDETTEEVWPENLLLRYLTVAGAYVHLYDAAPGQSYPVGCGGCGDSTVTGWTEAKEWAQSHAERCRAVPRPLG